MSASEARSRCPCFECQAAGGLLQTARTILRHRQQENSLIWESSVEDQLPHKNDDAGHVIPLLDVV